MDSDGNEEPISSEIPNENEESPPQKDSEAERSKKRKRSVGEEDPESDEANTSAHEYKRFKIVLENEQFKWSLPVGMAEYLNESFEKFYPEKELRDAVLVPNPCPDNMNGVRKLDDFLIDMMKEKKRTQEISMNQMLEKVQSKVHDIMGPLSKLWYRVEEVKNGEKVEPPTVEEMLTLIEQSITLVGQSANQITYERRKNALGCIFNHTQVASTLREKADILLQNDGYLFGKTFREQVVETMKAKKESLKALETESRRMKSSSSTGTSSLFYNRGNTNGTRMPFRNGPSSRNQYMSSRRDGGRSLRGNMSNTSYRFSKDSFSRNNFTYRR